MQAGERDLKLMKYYLCRLVQILACREAGGREMKNVEQKSIVSGKILESEYITLWRDTLLLPKK